MMRVLLFAGTSEGRRLAGLLAGRAVRTTISVATEYGRDMLQDLPHRVEIVTGRMDAEAMRETLRAGGYGAVVDATHPYAVAVSQNILRAADEAGVPRLRLARAASGRGDCCYVDSVAAAAARLAETEGNALLATGSKELDKYVSVPDFAARLYPRVLPTVDSLRRCEELGFRRDHIIAMQGPFGRELNAALMRHCGIRIMVTKDGGEEGGFPDKMLAAEELGVLPIVVGRPPDPDGIDLDALLARIDEMLEAGA